MEKIVGLEKVGWGEGEKGGIWRTLVGGMKKRCSLDILCTHTHTCAGSSLHALYAWGPGLPGGCERAKWKGGGMNFHTARKGVCMAE